MQRVACNKAKEYLTTNWDSALDLKKAPKTKEQNKKKQKQKKHTNMGVEKNILITSDL